MVWTLSARRRGGIVLPTPQLSLPFLGVQSPSPTTDYDAISTITGLDFSAVGIYNSIETTSGYISFPTATYNALADRGVKVIEHTMQMQSTGVPGFDPSNAPRYNAPSVLSGTHNVFLAQWYDAKAAWMAAHPDVECQDRWAHEMDGNWYPLGWLNGNNGNTPALVGQAFAYIGAIVKQHAPSVLMNFCPDSYSSFTNGPDIDTAWSNQSNTADVIFWDGYNWGPSSLGAHGWRSLSTIFAASRTWSEAKGLPWGISETGCPFAPAGSFADGTGDKSAWWEAAEATMRGWGGNFRGFFQEQNQNKDNVRINRLRAEGDYTFPSNGYGADTTKSYHDDSGPRFGAAFNRAFWGQVA